MKFSGFGKLNWNDLLNGLLVAVISGGIVGLTGAINEGRLPTKAEFATAGGLALAAGLGYLTKKFFTGTPELIQVDTTKTTVVDTKSKEVVTQPLPLDELKNL